MGQRPELNITLDFGQPVIAVLSGDRGDLSLQPRRPADGGRTTSIDGWSPSRLVYGIKSRSQGRLSDKPEGGKQGSEDGLEEFLCFQVFKI